MNVGSKVKVSYNHSFYPGREGIILSFGDETSSGIVILQDVKNNTVFTVDLHDIDVLNIFYETH